MDHKSSVLTQKYETGRLLGQGTFAKVYYARSIRTNQSVAIKVIDKEKILRVGLVEQIKREISVMRIVRHPNVVQLYEVLATKSKIYFVMEYCKGGELFNKVAKGKLKEEAARKYFQQLINAVDFCHSRGVYHRDIKPENLLLDENENLKITDFGLSALADCKHQDGLLHTTCGTPAYVAPEVINRRGYDGAKADIWSCGVVLYVLLAGYLPFHDSNLMEMYRKIGRAEFKCPNWFPQDARRLVFKMLDPNPNTRISIAKIKESSWFKKGLNSKQNKTEAETRDISHLERNRSGPSEINSVSSEAKQESVNPPKLNAFDIISLSAGFDLSGLFDENPQLREARFTSMQPASVIISKLEEIAKRLRLKITKKDAGLLKMEALEEGRKGLLSIDAEIFEVTPNFHLVEVKKSNGDLYEYQKILKDDIQPALHDIVCVWQDEQQQQPEPQQQQELYQQLEH
ncbi:CBL-interacting serine/threonine-protein kinase 10 [Ricinus communis]|uniref:non-specific serine/threonine protein kinase n=1 Tax=Ricinus communis TaxID=3988 RepID=B9RVE7_RICCO|nr:CBL-interacting serine/threonine-protein kinase 10 [Ricinus communis]XP_048226829.1 CBL-interacting serine/threonine-protein kinase 10 [Ricinus communis]EEF44648.1 CBL-interacting serine/threonine-protein kinase, putative [Ricinus communis]|eukprot:XP_002517716.1 CBL-interacting serine/threonine-protein kinase 10 [Ricinus communis]